MRFPELFVHPRQLGELRREVRSGMQLGVGEVSPHEAKGLETLQERLHRQTGGEAVRTSEVAVFDPRHVGESEPVAWSRLSTEGSGLDEATGTGLRYLAEAALVAVTLMKRRRA